MASSFYTSASSMAALLIVCALIGSAFAAEAPAPSPTSGAAGFSSSIIPAAVAAAVALIFGSALRI